MDRREHIPPLPPPTVDKIESFTCAEPVQTSRKKNRNKNNTRRFTDEQVKLLESMFETETKLEPRKKVQLARELGLQPRQVAIWFQNKRARWRSKHIEKEYTLLKADYDNLKSRYESSKKDKQSLLIQLQKLNDLLEQPHDRSKGRKDLAAVNSTDGNSEIGDNNCEYEANPCGLEEGSKDKVFTGLDEDKSRNIGNPGLEEAQEIMNKDEQVDGSLASPEKWCRVDSCGLFDQPCCDSHWWEFWTE